MTSPAWFSQTFPPEGASTAEGIRNQLGKPELDHLTILVRESAQNSWDARVGGGAQVHYRVNLQTVSAAHAPAWREHLLRNAPSNQHLPLRGSLQKPTIRVLSISDRGTKGLGGPTRADTVTDQGRDFVAFLRNIGEPRDQALGGGTYGFGKGILYLVSKPGTILVHTRCQFGGRYETRLMAASLWKSFDAGEDGAARRYTGRHWWGDTSGEVVEPLVGDAADSIAAKLGLSLFGPTETGTTVVVIDPYLEDMEAAEAAEYIAETIAWQLWPKMLPRSDDVAPMRFTVACDGIELPVPDPTKHRPLRLFARAYKAMTGPTGEDLHWRRTKLLGRFGLDQTMTPRFEATRAAEMAGFGDGRVHHICLMRPAELVVCYWPGIDPPGEVIAYAGVFRVDESMDETYAAAEPPTHDSWNPQSLEHPDSSYVKTTFTRLKEQIQTAVVMQGRGDVDVADMSLGAASDRLAPLVGGAWGVGSATDYARPGDTKASPRRRRPIGVAGNGLRPEARDGLGLATEPTETGLDGGVGHREDGADAPRKPKVRRPRVDYIGDAYLDEYWGNAVVVQKFRLPVPSVQRISAIVAVALATDGGIETEPPTGADMPGLVGWEDPAGQLHTTPTFVIEGGDGSVWKAIAKPAADTMTEIQLSVKAVEPR
ncbi:hypothetical protein [Nocardia rhamnosiphila]